MGFSEARGLVLFLLLFLFSSTSSFARTEYDKWLRKEFKAIIKRDQSHVRNNEVRDTLFLYNFNLISSFYEEDKMPQFSDSTISQKTKDKVELGLIITHIHILQNFPSLILNENRINLYSDYLNNGTMTKFILEAAMNAYTTDLNNERWGEISNELNHFYELAISTWNLNLRTKRK